MHVLQFTLQILVQEYGYCGNCRRKRCNNQSDEIICEISEKAKEARSEDLM